MLTKEELQDIKLPLSDDDYVMMHDYMVKENLELRLVSKELEEEYNLKMWTIYLQLFPGDNPDWNNLPWFPPQTEAYKDHPINVRLRERRAYFGSLVLQNPQLTEDLLQLEKKRKEEIEREMMELLGQSS